METKLIHITSGKGPAECCLAVALALKEMITEATASGLDYEVISFYPGEYTRTLESATLKVSGKNPEAYLNSWSGVLLWIAQSPYRKFHKRKNWFIGISEINASSFKPLNENEITFQTMRSSGPGGQHVNKTETAVRAIHKAIGLVAACDSYRSQLQNKQEAIRRLNEKHKLWQQTHSAAQSFKSEYENNINLSRGNPKRIYKGEKFKRE